MTSWRRYWFGTDGHDARISLGVVRIAVALAVWLTLAKMQGSWPANAPGAPNPPDAYRPVGIWMLAGGAPPSWLIHALWPIAKVATGLMLAGAFSRTATTVSLVTTLALASLYYSGFPAWSHGFNVVVLAHFALLGARCGDALSADQLVRTRRGLPAPDAPGGYLWSVRLVQLAVAVMFASGMFHKVMHGHLTAGWVLSDNLRNQLLVRFDLMGQPRTAIAAWIIDDVWRYRTVAALNLISQTVPLIACFLVRWPLLRALGALFFALETVALGVVMDLWNLHWLPLAVVFIDWDALIARLRTAPREPRPARPARPWQHAFVIAFVVYDLATAFIPHIDQRLNTYPFSSFPMFAAIRARTPYSEHLPYTVASGELEILASGEVTPAATRWVNYSYRKLFSVRQCREMQTRLASIVGDARTWTPTITGIRFHYAFFEAPPYPAPAELVPRRTAIIAELAGDAFRCALGSAKRTGPSLVVASATSDLSFTGLEVYTNDDPTPRASIPGPGPWTIDHPARTAAYVGVSRDDTGEHRWLIATTPR